MICVDYIQACQPNTRWRWDHVSHLYCEPGDDLSELHTFAQRLGLPRTAFQISNSGVPHYDLCSDLRLEAVMWGAREVLTRKEVATTIRAWRLYQSRSNR